MSKILLLTAILAVSLCNLHLNIKYRSFVDGEEVFSEIKAKEIYSQFYSPYTERSTYRFKIFSENLI